MRNKGVLMDKRKKDDGIIKINEKDKITIDGAGRLDVC
jgi:hypothetical protein